MYRYSCADNDIKLQRIFFFYMQHFPILGCLLYRSGHTAAEKYTNRYKKTNY